MASSTPLPHIFGFTLSADFVFLMPRVPYRFERSRQNARGDDLASLVLTTHDEGDHVPLFLVEKQEDFGTPRYCFTNVENGEQHVRTEAAYRRIIPWLDRYAIVIPYAAAEYEMYDEGPDDDYTQFAVGFAFGLRTTRRPVRVLRLSELAYTPVDLTEPEVVQLHDLTRMVDARPPPLENQPGQVLTSPADDSE